MYYGTRALNLILSGGGVKGIAFVGAYSVIQQRGYIPANIAGVSAGALAGAFIGAGYTAPELRRILYEFDFQDISLIDIENKVPAVSRYIRFEKEMNYYRGDPLEAFLSRRFDTSGARSRGDSADFPEYRGDILKNIVTFSNEGCLYDGDYLEQWVRNTLLQKGIRTFGDLRHGITDKLNPRGYKVRMTAVDANRGKIIVLPDDMAFYGMDPDKLEVCKAVRMSTSVPFVFKPVKLKKKMGNTIKTFNIVDGGVFDNFPFWLIEKSAYIPTVGFRLDGGKKASLISLNTPLKILKKLTSAVQDIGIPKNAYIPGIIGNIDTSKVSFLDLSLSADDKEYLYNSGKISAHSVLNSLTPPIGIFRYRRFYPPFINRWWLR